MLLTLALIATDIPLTYATRERMSMPTAADNSSWAGSPLPALGQPNLAGALKLPAVAVEGSFAADAIDERLETMLQPSRLLLVADEGEIQASSGMRSNGKARAARLAAAHSRVNSSVAQLTTTIRELRDVVARRAEDNASSTTSADTKSTMEPAMAVRRLLARPAGNGSAATTTPATPSARTTPDAALRHFAIRATFILSDAWGVVYAALWLAGSSLRLLSSLLRAAQGADGTYVLDDAALVEWATRVADLLANFSDLMRRVFMVVTDSVVPI